MDSKAAINRRKHLLQEIMFDLEQIPELLEPLVEDSLSGAPGTSQQGQQSSEGKVDTKFVPDTDPEMQRYFQQIESGLPTDQNLSRYEKNRRYFRNVYESKTKDPVQRILDEGHRTSYNFPGRFFPIVPKERRTSPKLLYPKRSRTVDQIKRGAIQAHRRRRGESLAAKRGLSTTPQSRQHSRKLKNKSIQSLVNRFKRNPQFWRRQERQQQKQKEWKGMADRKLWRKSKYNIRRLNSARAAEVVANKRRAILRGRRRSSSSPEAELVIRGIRSGLTTIRERQEPDPLLVDINAIDPNLEGMDFGSSSSSGSESEGDEEEEEFASETEWERD